MGRRKPISDRREKGFYARNPKSIFYCEIGIIRNLGRIYSLGEKLKNVKNLILRHTDLITPVLSGPSILQFAQELSSHAKLKMQNGKVY
jgi:hypothetical protein